MKIAKYLGIAVAVIVLGVAAGLAYVVATFDSARIKQEAAQAVLAKTGRTLAIDGDLGLSFWPSLGVKLARVSLSERDSKEQFAVFDAAHVSVRVLPLLSKQVIADRIELDGLKLILRRDKQGRLNIDDLLQGGEDKEKDDAGDDAQRGPPQFDIAGVHVSNATLEWRDQQAGRDIVLSPLDFEAGHAVSGAEGFSFDDVKFATRGKLDADQFEIKLDVPSLKKQGENIAVAKIGLSARLIGTQRSADVKLQMDNIAGTLVNGNKVVVFV